LCTVLADRFAEEGQIFRNATLEMHCSFTTTNLDRAVARTPSRENRSR
jgi:hypothetical protein